MIDFANKTFWLIGASEGLGRALAEALSNEGAELILSARSQERLDSLTASLKKAKSLPMDVTDMKSVRAAVQAAPPFDGIIYCAGTYSPMNARNWKTEAALQMVDVNFLGAMRVLGECVPAMIGKGTGDITIIGSLSGYRGLPGAIGYASGKSALMSLAETLRYDLRDTGVTVRCVNPGFVDTRLSRLNDFKMPQLMQPKDAARRVVRAMRKRRFRTDFPAPFSWFIRSLAFLPDFVVYRGK